MQTVYIELIIADNLLLDTVLLLLSVRLAEHRVVFYRILLAALLGAVYSVAAVLCYSLRFLPIKIAVSVAMIIIARGIKYFRGLIMSIAYFYALSMLLAGAILLIEYTSNKRIVTSYINFPVLRYVLIGLAIMLVIVEIILRKKQVNPGKTYLITAFFGKTCIKLKAALDTGNSITDIYGNGVIVADLSSVLNQLNCEEVCEIILKAKDSFSCSTVAGDKKLKGILPDKLCLHDNGRSHVIKGYIALTDGVNYKGCTALLPENLHII